jgi:hypothetical protein
MSPDAPLPLVVPSSDAISADGGYRSPRESKRRGSAIGEKQVATAVSGRHPLSRSDATLDLVVGAAPLVPEGENCRT